MKARVIELQTFGICFLIFALMEYINRFEELQIVLTNC